MSSVAMAERMYSGDLREVLRNRLAFSGGLVGTVIVGTLFGLLAVFVKDDCEHRLRARWEAEGREVWGEDFKIAIDSSCSDDAEPRKCIDRLRAQWMTEGRIVYSLPYGLAASEACPARSDEEEIPIDFDPGAILRLGEKVEEPEIPQQEIIQETRAEAEPEETVTVEDTPPPPKKEEKPPDKPKDKELPVSKIPTKKNTPFNDLPTVTKQRGDPFGQADGWADMAKDGDPWATSVMQALNNLKVGAFAAKAPPGTFKFQLTICKDGKIKSIARKGGTLPADTQNAVVLALNQTKLPLPPENVSKAMKSPCAQIKYVFIWTNGTID